MPYIVYREAYSKEDRDEKIYPLSAIGDAAAGTLQENAADSPPIKS